MSFENVQANPDPAQIVLEVPGSTEPVAHHDGTSTELDKYWKAVKDNPSDFTGWTYLLQFVEQDGNLETARPAFDAFLARYPYCYGYWKKYTDLEKKHAEFDEAEQVLERGLAAIPLSVDLWMHYINFVKERYKGHEEEETKIRQIYERAVAQAGVDFRSDKLWESYISWEEENGRLRHVMNIYDRLLTVPTQLYSHNYECFCEFVQKHNPKEILSLDEFLRLRQEVIKAKSGITEGPEIGLDDDVNPAEASIIPVESEAPPGDEVPPGEDEDATTRKMLEDETEIAAIREKIIETRKIVYRLNEQEVSRRWTFEEGIRRPYFHVKPLEKVQLKNWRDYLDMEIESGSHERTVILFERCLIACAMYEEFWMKYAKYLEECNAVAAENIYRKACTVFLKKKPAIHLAWAAFEEKQGNFALAEEILQDFEKEMPKLVMVQLRQITLARRQGNFEKVDQMYTKYMEDAASEKERSFFAIKRARFQAKALHDTEAARETLELAISKDELNEKLYLQLLDLEYQQANIDETRINAVFERAINKLEPDHKVAFSRRRMEFMEDLGCSLSAVQEAYESHQKLLKELNAQSGRKRKTEDGSGDDAQNDKKARYDAKQYSNGSSDYSSAYATPHTQGYDGYGMPQAHNYYGQSWNTGYNPMSYGYQNQWGPYSSQYYSSQ